MNQETVTYLTNIVIGVILAALATSYWWQRRRSEILMCWAVAAWVLTVADMLFAARQLMPHALGRLLPTLCVTVGQAILFLGAQRTAGIKPRWGVAGVVVLGHAIGLGGFLFVTSPANFRMAFNGLIWGGLSVASALSLRKGVAYFWQPVFSRASAFSPTPGFTRCAWCWRSYARRMTGRGPRRSCRLPATSR